MAFALLLAGGNNDVETTSFIFDSLVNITENYSTDVTRHPVESGTNISDHIFTKNPTFQLQGIVQNGALSQDTGNGAQNNIINEKQDRVSNAREQLKALYTNKRTFTLVLKYESIPNCVMTNLSMPRASNNSSVLTADMTIEQLRLVSSETIQIVAADPSIADASKNVKSTGGADKRDPDEYESEVFKLTREVLNFGDEVILGGN